MKFINGIIKVHNSCFSNSVGFLLFEEAFSLLIKRWSLEYNIFNYIDLLTFDLDVELRYLSQPLEMRDLQLDAKHFCADPRHRH